MASYRKTLYIIETSVFSMLMVFAILSLCKVRPFYPEGGIATHRPFQWDPVQARTVIVGSACAFLGIWGPMIVEHLTGFRVGKPVDLFIAFDLFVSVFLGEACQVYYNLGDYGFDKFLHTIGTAQLALAGFVLMKLLMKKNGYTGRQATGLCLLFGFFFGVAVEALWELYEGGADLIFHTNMQKYIPDDLYACIDQDTGILGGANGEMWNTGNCHLSETDMTNYYKTFTGYRYAVTDTDGDIIADACGALLGILSSYFVFKKYPEFSERILWIDQDFYKEHQKHKQEKKEEKETEKNNKKEE